MLHLPIVDGFKLRLPNLNCRFKMPRPNSKIASTLVELSNVFRTLAPPIEPRLRPPASKQEIRSAETKLNITFPKELKQLLACHDGQHFYDSDPGYGDPVIPMARWIPELCSNSHYWLAGTQQIVERTVRYREEFVEYFLGEEFEVYGPTSPHDQFIVITESENADCLVLDPAPERGGTVGQIVIYCTQPFEVAVVASSLSSFFDALLDGYNSGRFEFDDDEHFVSYGERF